MRGHLDQDDQHRKHHRALRELHARHPPRPAPRPNKDERSKDQRPREIAEPPGPKDAAELPGLDHITQPQRHDAEHRADQRPYRGTEHEREHIPDPLEPDPSSSQPTEQNRRNNDLERVPERLTQHRPPRRREVGHQQVADDDSRPDARPQNHERSHPHPHRRPQRRHAPVQVRQVKTGARSHVVQPGDDAHLDAVPREPSDARLPPRLQTLQRRTIVRNRSNDGRAQHTSSPRTVPPEDKPHRARRQGAETRPRDAHAREPGVRDRVGLQDFASYPRGNSLGRDQRYVTTAELICKRRRPGWSRSTLPGESR